MDPNNPKIDDFGDYSKLEFGDKVELDITGHKMTHPGPVFLVWDGFYQDPDRVRLEALSLEYVKTVENNYVGENSIKLPHELPTLSFVRHISGQNLQYNEQAFNGYRVGYEDSVGRSHIHTDSFADFTGICYLSRPEHIKGGTAFFRHKETGCTYMPFGEEAKYGFKSEQEMRFYFDIDTMNPDAWEMISFVPAAYNRFVLFRAALFHASWPGGFGRTKEDCRLVKLMFFDLKK